MLPEFVVNKSSKYYSIVVLLTLTIARLTES